MNQSQSADGVRVAKLVKFGVTGVGSTMIHILVAAALISGLGANTQVGNGTAFIVSTLFSYTVNTLWSFSNRISKRNALRFVVASLIGLALTVTISWTADSVLKLHYLIGIAMVVIIVPVYTFLIHSFWTYR